MKRLAPVFILPLMLLGAAAPGSAVATGCHWSTSASPPAGFDSVGQVSADSSTDAWAIVGVQGTDLVLDRWNGTSWSPMSVALPGGNGYAHISADAPDDAWLAGIGAHGSGWAYHWKGTSWRSVDLPNQRAIFDVSVVAPNDVWLLTQGPLGAPAERRAIEHWDGATWQVFAATTGSIRIAAFPHDDVFMTGANIYGGGTRFVARWYHQRLDVTVLPSNVSAAPIAGSSARHVWIVGETVGGASHPFATYFDGTAWTEHSPPALSKPSGANAVAVASPTSAWMVGGYGAYGLIEHWDGAAWTWVRHPKLGPGAGFQGVAAVPGSNMAWATGRVIERYC